MPSAKFYKQGRFLVKETYDSTGKIETKQYFNKDTTPDGAYTEYFDNGIIAKWIWFIPKYKNPVGGVYYYDNGVFDTFKGRPFLGTGNDSNNEPVIKLINPPQVKFRMGYKDIFNNKVVNEIYYDPILTDSISWVPLDEYKLTKGHKYRIYFYILDTLNKIFLFQDSINLKEH